MSDEEHNFEEKEVEREAQTHMLVSTGKFKGRPMLYLRKTPEDQYPFQFGLAKAKLILDNFEAIEDFVKKNSKED